MALDLCIEATAGLAHALESVWISPRIPGLGRLTEAIGNDLPSEDVLEDLILVSADHLPFDEARALWLVDVCRLGYSETASVMAVPEGDVASLVRQARRSIRSDLSGYSASGR